jgi:hypothetical protein
MKTVRLASAVITALSLSAMIGGPAHADAGRIPVFAIPLTINQSGSYFLVRDLTGVAGQNGITIQANNVTLDLNGFALIGVPGSDRGISIDPFNGVTVRNGTVRNWGLHGIFGAALSAGNQHFSDLTLLNNGAIGLAPGPNSTIVRCVASGNGDDGINASYSSVFNSTSTNNGRNGFGGTASSFIGCTTRSNIRNGFNVSLAHVTDCVAHQNTLDGIATDGYSLILNNSCIANLGAGIHVTAFGNRIEGNGVMSNARGIDVDAGSNLVIRNDAASNGTNYDIAAGNTVGPIVNSGNIATSDNPHANYEH